MNTLTNSHWDAVVALLRLAYPAITRERLESMLGGRDKDEYITAREACRIMRVSLPTLYRWGAAGRIRRARLSARKVLWSKGDIERMLGDAR